MSRKAAGLLGLLLCLSIVGVVIYTQGSQEGHDTTVAVDASTLTRTMLPAEESADLPVVEAASSFFFNAPEFQASGPRQVQISIVSLPDRKSVGKVAFWGTLMNQWEVYQSETNADGKALIALPTDGLWEFLCFAPGLGAGRVFNVDSTQRVEPWVMELKPFASSIRLRVVDDKTGKGLTDARFVSRHQDPDVLAYREPLAKLPDDLGSHHGAMNLSLEQPNIAYIWVEADGYQPAAVSVFEGGEDVVRLRKLQTHTLQILEEGEPVAATVLVTFHAAQHRFGTYAHSTLRSPETYSAASQQDGLASILLPSRLSHGGFALNVTSAGGTTRSWSHLQLGSIPESDWVLDLAD